MEVLSSHIVEDSLTSMGNECNCLTVWTFFVLALSLGLEWKLTFSSSMATACWIFQICWHIESSALTASYFRIWNSSAGIPSPSLALLVVILPKAHLTSYSKMSGSRWGTAPSWLSVSLRSFLYSSVCSCHLFLISSVSVRSLLFLP